MEEERNGKIIGSSNGRAIHAIWLEVAFRNDVGMFHIIPCRVGNKRWRFSAVEYCLAGDFEIPMDAFRVQSNKIIRLSA